LLWLLSTSIKVTMVPLYMTFNKMGLIGTYVPLVLPAFLGASAGYYVFMMRQFFMTIPDSLVQAARIDGASELRIYLQIMLPLCKPVIATVGVLVFLATRSDFLGPLLYLNQQDTYTLSLGLYAFMQSHYVQWEQLMAASAMFTVPIVILFFLAQKQFIEGIALTGIKG
jgi:multiple sugar transport system permease protein